MTDHTETVTELELIFTPRETALVVLCWFLLVLAIGAMP